MSHLDYRTVHPFSKSYWRVREVYLAVFPENERFPYLALTLSGYRYQHHLQAIYDEDRFIGMVYYVKTKAFLYLLFFGVSPQAQSSGYGSQILNDLKAKAADRTFILAVEALDEVVDNLDQRKRRVAFYERHGFQISPYLYIEKNDRYHLMATKPIESQKRLEHLLKQAVCYLVPISIKKMRNSLKIRK